MEPKILNLIKIDPFAGANLPKIDYFKINSLVSMVLIYSLQPSH